MKVVKVLNNSLVLALDSTHSEEVIIMGKGIGFNTKIGEELPKEKIEKIYALTDRDTLKKLIQLSAETDSQYFELSSQIIEYAKSKHDLQLKDHIYLALTDHISFIKKRMDSGYVFQNMYVMDLSRINPVEYDIAEYALKLLRESLDENIPDSELIYIAMHFVYQQAINDTKPDYALINKLVEEILNITKYQLQIEYARESIVYSRFLTHLSLFAQRLVTNEMIPNKESDLLLEQLEQQARKETVCLNAITRYVEEKHSITLSNQERLYLLIHIHKIYDEYHIGG